MTPERWATLCADLGKLSGSELAAAVAANRDEVTRWPAEVRHLDADSPWLSGLFEGQRDPRLELVGHATIRHRCESSEYSVRTGELFPIVAALGHHLDPAFDPPDVVLGQEDNIVSAYGCGGGSAWEKRGNEKQWIHHDCSATEHAAGMSSDDSWTAHGLGDGMSLTIEVEDSFGGRYGLSATGYAPALFDLAPVWRAVLGSATAEKVRSLLRTARSTFFPALDVLKRDHVGPEVGERFPLTTPRFTIGRETGNSLLLSSAIVSHRHCELRNEHGRWWLRQLASTNSTSHNGRRVEEEVELSHGDVISPGGFGLFRFLLHEPMDLRDAAMEQHIRDAPDDDRRWSVYADWLQERGDPLGERIANARPGDELRWLGLLAPPTARGELDIGWSHGVPSRVALRHLENHSDVEGHLKLVLAQPLFRFVRVLTVAASLFRRLRTEWAEEVLQFLGEDSLPMLESLRIGPGRPPPSSPRIAALLEARRRRWPCFTTQPQTLHFEHGPATLRHDSQTWALGTAFFAGPDLALGPGCTPFTLRLDDDTWRLYAPAEARIKVNGVAIATGSLVSGDVLEPGGGVRLHFTA